MKDNFSKQSSQYAQFRPRYPKELFEFLVSLCLSQDAAWDSGTGNGQFAEDLSAYFNIVFATDISEKQLKNALLNSKIIYKVEASEKTSFSDNSFDLITVAQAIHWFDFSRFYAEVNRVIKNQGVFAVVGYGLMQVDERVDSIINRLYKKILGIYWDKERKYIDEKYATIPFPFTELDAPKFLMEYDWTFEQLVGYLRTWSAVQHYFEKNNQDPVTLIIQDLKASWGLQASRKINFPLLLRIGKVVTA